MPTISPFVSLLLLLLPVDVEFVAEGPVDEGEKGAVSDEVEEACKVTPPILDAIVGVCVCVKASEVV
jgi:hypothetical protein